MRVGLREAGPLDRVGRGVINRCGVPACGLGGQNALGTGHFSEVRLGGPVASRVVAGHPATLAHAAPNRFLHVVPRQNRVDVLRPAGLLRLQFGPRRRRRIHREAGAGPLGVGEAVVPRGVTSAGGVAGRLVAVGVGAARAGLRVRGDSATREVAPLGRLAARIRPQGNPADLEAATGDRTVSAPVHVARFRSIEAGAGAVVHRSVQRFVGAVVVHSKLVVVGLSLKVRHCQPDGLRPLDVAVLMVIGPACPRGSRVVAFVNVKVARADAVGLAIHNARSPVRQDEAVGLCGECVLVGRWDRQGVVHKHREHFGWTTLDFGGNCQIRVFCAVTGAQFPKRCRSECATAGSDKSASGLLFNLIYCLVSSKAFKSQPGKPHRYYTLLLLPLQTSNFKLHRHALVQAGTLCRRCVAIRAILKYRANQAN
eukprot:scaffold117697_cov69-Phaeocystis_antarctica.AAC.2